MNLFFDTETTGFIHKELSPNHPSQPHLVELAAILAEPNGTVRGRIQYVVRPEGYEIPKVASDVHGITTAIAKRVGVPLAVAVGSFVNLRALAARMVAHNFPFDDVVIQAAIARTGRTPSHPGPTDRCCTMQLAMPILKLPPTPKMVAAGFDKYKPPSLSECWQLFFKEKLEGAHGAMADAAGCMRVYHHIRELQAA